MHQRIVNKNPSQIELQSKHRIPDAIEPYFPNGIELVSYLTPTIDLSQSRVPYSPLWFVSDSISDMRQTANPIRMKPHMS